MFFFLSLADYEICFNVVWFVGYLFMTGACCSMSFFVVPIF